MSNASPSPDDARRCLICGGPRQPAWAPVAGAGAEPHVVEVCADCGHGVLAPPPSAAELEAAYADAYGADGAKFHAPIERAIRAGADGEARRIERLLPDHCRRVLDVGCGRGVVLAALARRGVEAWGVERSAAAARGLDPSVRLVVAPDLAAAGLEPGSFGAITFRHVLEHLEDPGATLRAARRLLHPAGVLLVEVPDFSSPQARTLGRHWFHLDPPRHLHHFSARSLERAVRDAGFTVDEVRHGAALQDVMGWLQGALHVARRPHMGLYEGLHAGHRPPVLDLVGGMLLAPAALAASVVERLAGGGATVSVRASAVASSAKTETGAPRVG